MNLIQPIRTLEHKFSSKFLIGWTKLEINCTSSYWLTRLENKLERNIFLLFVERIIAKIGFLKLAKISEKNNKQMPVATNTQAVKNERDERLRAALKIFILNERQKNKEGNYRFS